MTREQAEQFIAAFNALLTISTKGEDTRTMAHVLEIMEHLANTVTVVSSAPAVSPVLDEEVENG